MLENDFMIKHRYLWMPAVGKRKDGLKTGSIIESDAAETLLFVREHISRRLLSRPCLQAFDRLCLFMGANGLKNTHKSCV